MLGIDFACLPLEAEVVALARVLVRPIGETVLGFVQSLKVYLHIKWNSVLRFEASALGVLTNTKYQPSNQ